MESQYFFQSSNGIKKGANSVTTTLKAKENSTSPLIIETKYGADNIVGANALNITDNFACSSKLNISDKRYKIAGITIYEIITAMISGIGFLIECRIL